MRVTLIHNPGAGRQGGGQAARLRKLLVEFGHEVRYHSSKEKGWKRALRKPADLIAIAGGDGTVSRVTRRMVGRGVPIALLPAGTANNIARTLGMAERPFEDLVRGWEAARLVKLDVGVAAGPWGERHFIEGVGAGLFAGALIDRASKKLKKRDAAVAHALGRLRRQALRCRAVEVACALDGRDISGNYLLLEAVNLRYVGPNLHLAHDSRPGDGHMHVVLVGEAERDRLLYYLEHWQDNRERLALLPTLRGRRLQIEWTGFALHIDDKLRPKEDATPKEIAGLVDVRIDEGNAVEFLVPA